MAEHVVYEAARDNQIVGVYATASAASAAAALVTGWTAGQIADDPAVDVGWFVDTSASPNTASAVLPAARRTAVYREGWYRRISEAFVAGVELLNRAALYRSRIGLAQAPDYNAAAKWLFHTAALAKLTVDGTVFASLSSSAREVLLAHFELHLTARADTAFATFVGDDDASQHWAALSCADGAAVNTDLVTVQGAPKSQDGTNAPIAGATIPAKFSPENPALI